MMIQMIIYINLFHKKQCPIFKRTNKFHFQIKDNLIKKSIVCLNYNKITILKNNIPNYQIN